MSEKVCKVLYHPELVIEDLKTYLGVSPLLVAVEKPDGIPVGTTCTGTFRA